MSIDKIGRILRMHGVPFIVSGGRIYADSMISGTRLFEHVEDVTDWSRQKLFAWLGY